MAKKNRNSKTPITAPKKKNTFAIWVTTAAVAAVAVIVAVVVWGNSQSGGPARLPDAAAASNIIEPDGGIRVKEGDKTVGVYLDPMCPACRAFEQSYTPVIEEQEGLGLVFHPIAILDRLSQGTLYSTRSAASIYAVAVASPESVSDYVKSLYANQPAEGSTGLPNDQLISLAEQSGATITEADIEKWQKYVVGAVRSVPIGPGASGVVTPTVTLDDKFITRSGNPATDIAGWVGQ